MAVDILYHLNMYVLVFPWSPNYYVWHACQILINMLSLQFLNQKGKLRAGSSAIEFTQL